MLQIVEYPKLENKKTGNIDVTLVIEGTSVDKLRKDLIVFTPLTCMPILKKDANFEEESSITSIEEYVNGKSKRLLKLLFNC